MPASYTSNELSEGDLTDGEVRALAHEVACERFRPIAEEDLRGYMRARSKHEQQMRAALAAKVPGIKPKYPPYDQSHLDDVFKSLLKQALKEVIEMLRLDVSARYEPVTQSPFKG